MACQEQGYLPKLVIELKCVWKNLEANDYSQGRDYARTLELDPLRVVLVNQPPGSYELGQNRPAPPTTVHLVGDDKAVTWGTFEKEYPEGDDVELRRVVEEAIKELYDDWCIEQAGFQELDYQEVLREALVKNLDSKKYYVTMESQVLKGRGKKRSDHVIWLVPS